MKKKLFLFILPILFVLSGCNHTYKVTTPPSQPSPTILNFVLPQIRYKPVINDIINQFEDKFPTIKINIQVIPDNQWTNLISTQIYVHELPDLIWATRGLILQVGEDNFIQLNEDEPWYNNLIDNEILHKSIDGVLYGLPLDSYKALGLICNKNIFKKYGLEYPTNWTELLDICQYFTSKGILPIYASDKDLWSIHTAYTIAASQVISENDWNMLKSSQTSCQLLDPLKQVMLDLRILWEYANTDHENSTYESAINIMASEKVAMYISDESFLHNVNAINPDLSLELIPLPYKKQVLTMSKGTEQICIPKETAHIQQAKVFLAWLATPEIMDQYCEGWGGTPIYNNQQYSLSPYQQLINDNYIIPKKTVLQIDNIWEEIDFETIWAYERSMLNDYISLNDGFSLCEKEIRVQLNLQH